MLAAVCGDSRNSSNSRSGSISTREGQGRRVPLRLASAELVYDADADGGRGREEVIVCTVCTPAAQGKGDHTIGPRGAIARLRAADPGILASDRLDRGQKWLKADSN